MYMWLRYVNNCWFFSFDGLMMADHLIKADKSSYLAILVIYHNIARHAISIQLIPSIWLLGHALTNIAPLSSFSQQQLESIMAKFMPAVKDSVLLMLDWSSDYLHHFDRLESLFEATFSTFLSHSVTTAMPHTFFLSFFLSAIFCSIV